MRPPGSVVVVGAGLAGLCAALASREAGAQVVLLEASPKAARGGNTRFSNGSFRIAHGGIGTARNDDLAHLVDLERQPHAERARVDAYSTEEFTRDVVTTSRGRSNREELALVVDESYDIARWLASHGVIWELNLKFTQIGDLNSNRCFDLDPGASLATAESGTGLVESLFAAAEMAGIEIRYETVFDDFVVTEGEVVGARVFGPSGAEVVSGSVVLASGGFEANPEMRRKYLGPGWDLVAVRGSRYNTGRGLDRALALGATPVGHWGGCHSVPTDASIPLVGDLELSQRSERYSYADGLLINEDGRRFIDEGEDLFTMTYTKVGAAIAAQPGGVAYQVFDAAAGENLQQHYYTHGQPITASSIEDLAVAIGVPVASLSATVADFNNSCDQRVRRDVREMSAAPVNQPPKSQWAVALQQGPFVAYKVTAGISFTYGGIMTLPSMAVQHIGGHAIGGLCAAGGVVGGLFFHNYPAAAALTRAAVCGRQAGRTAAGMASRIAEPATAVG